MTDCKNLELARQWAADIDADRETLSQDTIDAAADLISSLPDEWVDADALRKYIADWREGLATAPRGNYEDEMLDDLEDMLPAPPAPRTMDEIEWDDAEHHLAEARVAVDGLDGNISDTVIMLGVNRFGNISALDTSTWAAWALSRDTLTPTGRKYRLAPEDDTPTSPIEDKPAPEPAAPRPEDVPEGEAWQVETPFMGGVGYRHARQANPWFVTYPGHSERTWHVWNDSEVTLVARLVPETTEQDDEPVFDPAYIYSDRYGCEWECIDGKWAGGDAVGRKRIIDSGGGVDVLPAEYGPYTRIEKEETNE